MNHLDVVRARGLALSMLVALLGCGGGDGNGDAGRVGLEGKFFYQVGQTPGQGMTLELQKTGIAIGTRPGGQVRQGTYQVQGDKVTVLLEGDAAKLEYTMQDDGNLATTFYGNETAVFVKQ